MIGNSLISIAPKYVSRMRAGTKRIEVRRRMLNLAEGSVVWIYETSPVNSITSYFKVSRIEKKGRELAWKEDWEGMGISREEFDNYIQGLDFAVLVHFEELFILRDPLHLDELQEQFSSFRPPQFYSKLSNDEFILSLATSI